MTAGVEAVLTYRKAAKRHRREALLHQTENRPLSAAKERAAAERITRAIRAEVNDPRAQED